MSYRVVQFLDSLGRGRGGLTRAVYSRMQLLPKDVELVVAVTGVQFGVKKIFDELREGGQIPKRAQLRAFFDERFELGALSAVDRVSIPALLPPYPGDGYVVRETSRDGHLLRHFDRMGRFLGFERFADPGGHKTIEERHREDLPHQIEKRAYFDEDGRVRRVVWFDAEWNPRYEVFLDVRGDAWSAAWMSETGKRYRVIDFDGPSGPEVVGSLNGLRLAWLRSLDASGTVYFSDEPSTIFALADGRAVEGARGVAVIHTVHYANNADPSDGFRGWYSSYRQGRGKVDHLVTCTETQRDAVISDGIGWTQQNSVAIPHAAPPVQLDDRNSPSQALLYLGRLHKDKNVDLVIRAFAKALDSVPNAVLHIVGGGPELAALKQLSADLNISNKVLFHGYDDQPLSWFERVDAQILLSRYEGFGLTITEGWSRGCPTIGTASVFGPAYLLKDRVNALVVPKAGNVVGETALRMVEVMTDDRLWRSLREGAVDWARRFSDEAYRKAWLGFIDGLDLGERESS